MTRQAVTGEGRAGTENGPHVDRAGGRPSTAIRRPCYPKSDPSPNPDLTISDRGHAHHKRARPQSANSYRIYAPACWLASSSCLDPLVRGHGVVHALRHHRATPAGMPLVPRLSLHPCCYVGSMVCLHSSCSTGQASSDGSLMCTPGGRPVRVLRAKELRVAAHAPECHLRRLHVRRLLQDPRGTCLPRPIDRPSYSRVGK